MTFCLALQRDMRCQQIDRADTAELIGTHPIRHTVDHLAAVLGRFDVGAERQTHDPHHGPGNIGILRFQ